MLNNIEWIFFDVGSTLVDESNAYQPFGTEDRLRLFGILEDIDLVVASEEEGVSKPDLKIFQIALQRANCMPQSAVMVGDRLDNDIAPAKTLGMKTVWIKQGFGKYSTPGSELEKAEYIVNNLKKLCELFVI